MGPVRKSKVSSLSANLNLGMAHIAFHAALNVRRFGLLEVFFAEEPSSKLSILPDFIAKSECLNCKFILELNTI